MSKTRNTEIRTEELLEGILADKPYEIVDVEFVKEVGNWYLRIYIDKDGGINIDDCEIVSRSLSDILDEEDFISESYILEVSSPGLGRQLKKDRDFKRSIGEDIEVKLYGAINKQKEFLGELVEFDEDSIVIEKEDASKMKISRKDIAIVRLAIDF